MSKDLLHVAIVGLGNTQGSFTSAVANGKHFDEIWAINSMMVPIKHDIVFMMDPASRFLDTENAGLQTEAMRKELSNHPGPIYTCELDKRVPGAVLYPLKEVVEHTGLCYFNNTVPYAIAFAIYAKVTHLYLYGIDYSYSSNIHMAEAGRACTEFWLSTAISRGLKIEVAQGSTLLDTNVPDEEKLYGYHRLKDPLVLSSEKGSLSVAKKSKVALPEPLDSPVLYGRHDSIVSLKEASNV
ncbi:MAG TPA: hypothetical protein DF712_20405 [Balneola sp.]|nr:hypothetical protein [Balneola sp.]|tara:strand:- start:2919 stop:3638 length:720 start_codon:yes stop_codon:yes gene_type:complete